MAVCSLLAIVVVVDYTYSRAASANQSYSNQRNNNQYNNNWLIS